MEKAEKIVVLICAVWFALFIFAGCMFFYLSGKVGDEIRKNGVKGIVDQVWNGSSKIEKKGLVEP